MSMNDDVQREWSLAPVWKLHKLYPMNQNNLQIPDPDTGDLRERTVSSWALKYGRKTRRWGDKRVAGDKDGERVFDCVSLLMCPLEHPQACLLRSLRGLKPIGSALWAYMVLAGAGTDRQLLLNPDCFRFTGCERVWLRGCDPSEGGLSPPLSLTSPPLSLEGGRRVWWGGDCRHHVMQVSCWADQNGIWTKTHHLLLPDLWVPVCHKT